MVGSVFSQAFAVLRKHPMPFAMVALAIGLVAAIYGVVYQSAFEPLLETAAAGDTIDTSEWVSLMWLGLIGGLIVSLASLAGSAFMIVMASDAIRGDEPTVGRAWAVVKERLWVLVGAYLLVLVLFLGGFTVAAVVAGLSFAVLPILGIAGFIAIAVAAVWLGVTMVPLLPTVLGEQVGATESIKRSFALVKGSWWSVFGTMIVIALATGVVQAPFGLIPAPIGTFFVVLVYAAVAAFQAAAVNAIYIELKVRQGDGLAV